MTCLKCKATWAFGPSDICPICHGAVVETPGDAKAVPLAAPPATKAP